jgi:1,4-dihydroxy-2-naphthoate polyprenyltransferase
MLHQRHSHLHNNDEKVTQSNDMSSRHVDYDPKHVSVNGSPSEPSNPPSWSTIWWTAARPHTLTASISPCLVMAACVITSIKETEGNQNPTQIYVAIALWFLFCVTIQLGTNLHNDYADFVMGNDRADRIGHARATARGWLTPAQTCMATTLILSVTTITGITLLFSVASPAQLQQQQQHFIAAATSDYFAWFILMSGIYNAFAYSGGPYPLGYLRLLPYREFSLASTGLGDLFVFLYFGLVAVLMIPYLLLSTSPDALLDITENSTSWVVTTPYIVSKSHIMHSASIFLHLLSSTDIGRYAIQVGLLGVNIIVVNNLRDRQTDAVSSKRTTAVRFGRTFSLMEYISCLLLTLILVIVDVLIHMRKHTKVRNNYNNNNEISKLGFVRLLPFLVLPVAWAEVVAVIQKDGAALNPHVGGAALVQFFFCILLSMSLVISPDPESALSW